MLSENGAFIHLLCSVLKLATKGCFMSMEYGFSCSRHNCHLPAASPHDVTLLQPGKCHFEHLFFLRTQSLPVRSIRAVSFEHLVFLHTRRWQQTLCPCRCIASGLSLRALGFPAHSVCEEWRAFRVTLLHALLFAENTNEICSDTFQPNLVENSPHASAKTVGCPCRCVASGLRRVRHWMAVHVLQQDLKRRAARPP